MRTLSLTERTDAGYHHQVSHHIHCNDDALDEDVFSAFPLLRFDPRLPKMWFHQFQHIYMWFTFPLLQVGFQVTDLLSLAVGRTPGASLYGATNLEKATTLLGKVVHFSLLLAIPISMHGASAVIPATIAYIFTQGLVLASTFAVSHNVPETKPLHEGGEEIAAAVRTLLLCSGFQKLPICMRTDTCTMGIDRTLLLAVSHHCRVLIVHVLFPSVVWFTCRH
jgi:hypothetical protein